MSETQIDSSLVKQLLVGFSTLLIGLGGGQLYNGSTTSNPTSETSIIKLHDHIVSVDMRLLRIETKLNVLIPGMRDMASASNSNQLFSSSSTGLHPLFADGTKITRLTQPYEAATND